MERSDAKWAALGAILAAAAFVVASVYVAHRVTGIPIWT